MTEEFPFLPTNSSKGSKTEKEVKDTNDQDIE